MKKLMSVMALFVISLLAISMVSADTLENKLEIDKVEVNGQEAQIYGDFIVGFSDSVDDLDAVSVDEGEVLKIEVELEATSTAKDIEVEAELSGYEYSDYDDLDDRTHLFDMEVSGSGSTSKKKQLEITLPKKLDKDRYLLRLTVDNKDSHPIMRWIVLQVTPARHGVEIADVVFSPGTTVKAGRSLLTTVLLENYGDKHEKDVKVTVAVPELGVSATEFVDVVKMDDVDGFNNVNYEDVPEMFLPVPAVAAEGDYQVEVTVSYDDLHETVKKIYTVHVMANEMFQNTDKLVLAVGPETQAVSAGQTATYGVALTNAGATSKAYMLDVATGGWATASLSENLVVLEPGKNKVVYVELSPVAGTSAGEHLASLTVKSGSGDVLETVPLKANVASASEADSGDMSLRNGLEIALIILVVLLVIIGLIIGFSRLKNDEEGEEEQTYY